MKHCRTISICVLGLISTASVCFAQIQSVEEARALSVETGRPIFAVAGNKK